MFWRQVIIGLMLGATLGWCFKRQYPNRPLKGPSSRSVKRTVYYDEDTKQHYRFHPVTHVCPPSIDVDALEHSDDSSEDWD